MPGTTPTASFDEKHPRGQPDNPGQFKSKQLPSPPAARPRRRGGSDAAPRWLRELPEGRDVSVGARLVAEHLQGGHPGSDSAPDCDLCIDDPGAGSALAYVLPDTCHTDSCSNRPEAVVVQDHGWDGLSPPLAALCGACLSEGSLRPASWGNSPSPYDTVRR